MSFAVHSILPQVNEAMRTSTVSHCENHEEKSQILHQQREECCARVVSFATTQWPAITPVASQNSMKVTYGIKMRAILCPNEMHSPVQMLYIHHIKDHAGASGKALICDESSGRRGTNMVQIAERSGCDPMAQNYSFCGLRRPLRFFAGQRSHKNECHRPQ